MLYEPLPAGAVSGPAQLVRWVGMDHPPGWVLVGPAAPCGCKASAPAIEPGDPAPELMEMRIEAARLLVANLGARGCTNPDHRRHHAE